MSFSQHLPIIIVGAGIVGLSLAQALKKEGIPFQVYERDKHLDARSAGWGISIHWALPAIESCLPPNLFKELDSIQVDPQQGLKGMAQLPKLRFKKWTRANCQDNQ
jgi:2-polyprenyl-6-methoxyphenol hydroxylase-like FAD-dependent oxidoreductase